MEKAARLFTAVLNTLAVGHRVNSAGLLEEQATINRAKHVASARTAKSSSWQAKAKADAILGLKYDTVSAFLSLMKWRRTFIYEPRSRAIQPDNICWA